ncbi:MAG: hypothetical protein DRP45_04520 [Candidatus Zixiibacteriota bacterium]|nr:MAG: hypothetical protein DRP45_04520 [candidate division Zixibacteria bacterium]
MAYRIKGPDKKTDEGLLSGNIKKTGVTEGDHEIELCGILDAQWSVKEAKVGDKVKITAKTTGIKSGESVAIQVFVKDANFADRLFDSLEAKVQSNKIEIDWELKVDEKLEEHADYKEGLGRYSVPFYFFVVHVSDLRQTSGLLKYQDWMELELTDEDGEAIGGTQYTLYLPSGETRTGKLDSDGYAKVEQIPPGKVNVTYDTRSADE